VIRFIIAAGLVVAFQATLQAQETDITELPLLQPGKVVAQNALWGENPKDAQFTSSKRVVVAKIDGPATITMIHFAMPEKSISDPKYVLGRDLLIRMYWDGETTPSVDCPLVDFFCDPAGLRESVNTALVNKRRGFNAYFAMPFRKSGRIELVYDGPTAPGPDLWRMMPCYSYVMYRKLENTPENLGYFHARWRQEKLPLGQRDYIALMATGNGKFIGWNVTVRRPGPGGYPVDENEKFYVDGEAEPSVEFQGLEDSFGFSWGFPPTENLFPLTGYFPFKEGAAAYRFFTSDAIRFEKSLKVAIGFGKNEDPSFRRQFSGAGNELEFSSTCYWYQAENHAEFPQMLPVEQRSPSTWNWKEHEQLPAEAELKERGVKLYMRCGRPEKEVVFAAAGYGAKGTKGYTFAGWPVPLFSCRAGDDAAEVELSVPKSAAGKVRVYVIDPDTFQGGRKQEVFIAGKSAGKAEHFEKGQWIEQAVEAADTAEGKVIVRAVNRRSGSNAVISVIEWVEAK